MTENTSTFISTAGKPIYVTIANPDIGAQQHNPLVLLLPGFKGFRNWGFFPYTSARLAEAGYSSARIDFSMNGMDGGDDKVVLEADFATSTITQDVADVHTVIDQLIENNDISELCPNWSGRLHLIGHSRGGGVAQLIARDLIRTDQFRSTKCVCWNSVGHWNRWTPRQVEAWEKAGYITVENTRTGQVLRQDFSIYQDFQKNMDALSIKKAAAEIRDSVLYLHATGDITVNIQEIRELLKSVDNENALDTITGSTHTFAISHPFTGTTPSLERTLEKTLDYLNAT